MTGISIHSKLIKRIIVTGSMEHSSEALNYCYRNNYRTTWSGPMPIAKYRYDTKRFRIIAEKEVERAISPVGYGRH
jgi:hypothetical protein